jgi:hypothetical protein
MAKRKPLTDDEGEVRELTGEDFAQMVPFSALPIELQDLLTASKQTSQDVKAPAKQHPAA